MNSIGLALAFYGINEGFPPPAPGGDDTSILGLSILGAFILGQG